MGMTKLFINKSLLKEMVKREFIYRLHIAPFAFPAKRLLLSLAASLNP